MSSTCGTHHSTRRSAGQLAVAYDRTPAQKHIPDGEAELPAVESTLALPRPHQGRANLGLAIRIDYDQVGIEAGRDRSFRLRKPAEPRRAFAHPAGRQRYVTETPGQLEAAQV